MEHGFGIFMHFLQFYSMDNLHFRTTTLNSENPDLLQDLLKVNKEEMSPSEKLHWRLITDLYMDNMWGVPDSDDIPFVDVVKRMRLPITIGSESDTEGENSDEDMDMEPSKPENSLAEANDPLTPSAGENMDIDKERDGGEPLREPTDGLDLSRNDESVHQQGGSLIDRGLGNDENLLTHLTRDVESDEDVSEKEYIPFTIWSLIRKASILQRREQNSVKIFEFLDENAFFEFYAPVSEGLFCRSPEAKVWLSGIEARITHLGIVGHLSKYGLGGYVSISPICAIRFNCCSLLLRIPVNF
jgi:hypothetical protein